MSDHMASEAEEEMDGGCQESPTKMKEGVTKVENFA